MIRQGANRLPNDFLEARAAFRERLSDPQIAALVESFEADKYNDNATLGENLLFGMPLGGAFNKDRLAENAYVLEVLDKAGLTDDLLEGGQQVASLMVELFADLPPGHQFLRAVQLHQLRRPARVSGAGQSDRTRWDGRTARRRSNEAAVVAVQGLARPPPARRDRRGRCGSGCWRPAVSLPIIYPTNSATRSRFFGDGIYNAAASLQDNILFGKLAYGQARGAERVGKLIAEVIDALELRPDVMEVGLGFEVGIGGARLSAAQRQKLAIARAILKRPDVLVLDEATTGIDGPSQTMIMDNLLKEFDHRGLVWVLPRASLAAQFDRVLVMQGGKVVEQGTFDELDKDGSALRELVSAE